MATVGAVVSPPVVVAALKVATCMSQAAEPPGAVAL